MLINKLYSKSLIIKAFLYIVILVVLSTATYKIYKAYNYVVNFTATNFTDWLQHKNYNNFNLQVGNIKFNPSLFNIDFYLENIQLKYENNIVHINNIQGKVNILFYILYNKIKITNLVFEKINLNLNNISNKSIINHLAGRADCYLNYNNIFTNIKLFLLEPIKNTEFNLDFIFNINDALNHITIKEFRLSNIANDVRELMQYLPEHFINYRVLQWLNNAVLSGSIDKNELIWAKDDTFSWKINFKNVTLKYLDSFPPLENLCITMNIINDAFEIQMDSGDLQGFVIQQPIKALKVTLNNINADNLEPLSIKAAIVAPISKGLEFIKNSNIKYLGQYLYEHNNILQLQGNMELSINLSIPLEFNSKQDTIFDIICNFNNVSVRIGAIDIDLTNLSGNIYINNNYISLNNLAISNKSILAPIKFTIRQDNIIVESSEITATWLLNQQQDFLIKELNVFGIPLGSIKFGVNASREALFFEHQYAMGHVLISDLKRGNYVINFEQLRINDTNINTSDKKNSILNKINNIRFNCKDFYFNNVHLGEVQGAVNNNTLQVNGKANFNNFHANIPIINNGAGCIDFNIAWSDYIQGLLWKNISGQINIELKNGVIMGIEPGLGRVIGLLSIENIKRRLSLDFTDVTNPGFAFDTLNGKLEAEAGVMHIKYMVIQGPAAKMVITGEVSLLDNKQINLFVEVSSKIGATLPIAAAIAVGNPIVGAAIWLFDKVSNLKVGELQVEKYKIVGDLEHPEIIEL